MSLPVPGRFGDLGGVGVLAQGDGAGAQLLLGMPEDFMYGFHVWGFMYFIVPGAHKHALRYKAVIVCKQQMIPLNPVPALSAVPGGRGPWAAAEPRTGAVGCAWGVPVGPWGVPGISHPSGSCCCQGVLSWCGLS